ncbi:MAG: hypothetical protein AB7F96_15400 [Beijerinckiaceae bacterium]
MLIFHNAEKLLRESARRLVKLHIKHTGEAITSIGRAVFNDPKYLSEILDGTEDKPPRQVTAKAYDKLYAYIMGELKKLEVYESQIVPELCCLTMNDIDMDGRDD